MYVTRPLSQLLKSPEVLAEPPPGPNSGYLVIQDEESETYLCFGCCKNQTLKDLPFPQNKEDTRRSVKRSLYYELALESERWEQIFTSRNSTNDNRVAIDVVLEKEEVFVGGRKAVWDEKSVVDGVIWFTSYGLGGEEMRVGLRVEIVERMKWEQERGGWVRGEERRVRINIVEEFKEGGGWSEFGCYVLVERFNLKRMDGSLVMSYDFRHFHHMRTKWE
ncbi:hypothetical protein DH2020_032502 [Rehmannia glutinosa]|uniref:F-box protein n=1 Tax=Rehmannia glutinosa TaxID=99300 RepID=A0ABR0VF92_REHGL